MGSLVSSYNTAKYLDLKVLVLFILSPRPQNKKFSGRPLYRALSLNGGI